MLQKLKAKWYHRLKTKGFIDIEDNRGNLKSYDRRTQAFDNRERILSFFLELTNYIAETQLSRAEKQILESYAKGYKIKDIATVSGHTRQWVHRVIKHHKIIMGILPVPRAFQPKVILRRPCK